MGLTYWGSWARPQKGSWETCSTGKVSLFLPFPAVPCCISNPAFAVVDPFLSESHMTSYDIFFLAQSCYTTIRSAERSADSPSRIPLPPWQPYTLMDQCGLGMETEQEKEGPASIWVLADTFVLTLSLSVCAKVNSNGTRYSFSPCTTLSLCSPRPVAQALALSTICLMEMAGNQWWEDRQCKKNQLTNNNDWNWDGYWFHPGWSNNMASVFQAPRVFSSDSCVWFEWRKHAHIKI